MRKIFTAISTTALMASLLALPVSAEQAITQSYNTKEIKSSYCPTCTAVGIPYPKKDYSRSDFIGATIQYNGYTYYFSHIDDSLSNDTRWWTVWIR